LANTVRASVAACASAARDSGYVCPITGAAPLGRDELEDQQSTI
jgi:hypothetical protein